MYYRISLKCIFVIVTLLYHEAKAVGCYDKSSFKNVDMSGIIVPVFTPFRENSSLEINPEVITQYAEFLCQHNVNGVLVAAPNTGEGVAVSLNERKIIIEAWVSASKSCGLVVIAMASGMSTPDVFELARFCNDLGVPILCLPSLYATQRTAQQLVTFIAAIAREASSVPVLYYDNPGRTGVNVNMPEFFRQATEQIPNFSGVLGSIETCLLIRSIVTPNSNQYLMAYGYIAVRATFELGLNTSVTGLSNIFPGIVVRIMNNVNNDSSRRDQNRLNTLTAILLGSSINNSTLQYVGYLKSGLYITNGIKVGTTRFPLDSPPIEEQRRITAELQREGIKVTNPVE